MFLFVGVVMAVLQGGVVRRIPLGKEKAAAMAGLLLIVPSFVIVGNSRTIAHLYTGLGLYAIATISTTTTTVTTSTINTTTTQEAYLSDEL